MNIIIEIVIVVIGMMFVIGRCICNNIFVIMFVVGCCIWNNNFVKCFCFDVCYGMLYME